MNLAVTDFESVPMSPVLAATLARASDAAAAMGASDVALEHLLGALCDDADAVAVLDASQVSIARLKTEISAFLANKASSAPAVTGGLGVSQDLRRILEAAAAAARGGKRRDINGAIVLAAIVGDGNSVAAQILQALGLTFDEAIRALQSALSQSAQRDGQPAAGATDDVLARARERVQSRAAPSLREIMNDLPRPAPPPPMPASAADAVLAEKASPKPAPEMDKTAGPKIETKPSLDALKPVTPAASISDRPLSHPVEKSAAPSPVVQPTPHMPPAPQALKPAGYAYPTASPAPPQNAPVEDVLASMRRSHPGTWSPPPMPPPIPAAIAAGGARAPAPSMPWPSAGGPSPTPQPPFGAPGPRLGAPSAPGSAPATSQPMPSPASAPRARAPAAAKRDTANKVETGQLAENIPRGMRVGKTERVEIRVAKAAAKAIIHGLEGGGVVWRHEITVTQAMSVRLRAPEGGFFIETASPETQWVESQPAFASEDFASWRFLVTPQSRGWARLQIIVSARTVGADGMTAETAMPDQVVEVKVRTNLKRTFARWFGWIIAAVAGGALAKFGEAGLVFANEYLQQVMATKF